MLKAPTIESVISYRTGLATDLNGEYTADDSASNLAIIMEVSFDTAPSGQVDRYCLDEPSVQDEYKVTQIQGLSWEMLDVGGYTPIAWGSFEPPYPTITMRTVISSVFPQNRYRFKAIANSHSTAGDTAASEPSYFSVGFGERRIFPVAEGYMKGANDTEPIHIALGMYEDEDGLARGTIYSDGASRFTIGDRGTPASVFDDFFSFDYTDGLSVKAQGDDVSYAFTDTGMELRDAGVYKGSFFFEDGESGVDADMATLSDGLLIGNYMFSAMDRQVGADVSHHLRLRYYGG